MPKKRKPAFLSPIKMKRAFQARLMSLDPNAKTVTKVRVEHLGGFEDRSYRLRYTVTVKLKSGKARIIRLRGSAELQDQTRRQAYVIMRYLWHHGFNTGPNQVSQPVTFFWRWRLLLYHQSPGLPLGGILRRSPRRAPTLMKQTADWLAQLHRHSPRTIQLAYNQNGRKQYWNQALRLLQKNVGPNTAKLERVIRKVMAYEDRLARGRHRVLVHHDFHPGNVLASPSVLRVLDFTESRLSHPLVDVATFVTQLELQRGTIPRKRVQRWRKIFLSTYHRRVPHLSLTSPRSRQLFRFMEYRIALQTHLGQYLLGHLDLELQKRILSPSW